MSEPAWKTAIKFEDITYKKSSGVARIAFNRPDVRNAFRPKTTSELYKAFYDANEDTSIGVVLLSAEGPSSKDGVFSFCSGGDQKARGHQGYVGEDGYHRLNILEVQRLIRFMPKVVIAVVPGWAVGGGHVAAALALRHLKRIAAHSKNITTSIVMPVDKLDFFDER